MQQSVLASLKKSMRLWLAYRDAVAKALFRAGYFGPFGIDGYRYDWAGASGFCALSEINARFTMDWMEGMQGRGRELLEG